LTNPNLINSEKKEEKQKIWREEIIGEDMEKDIAKVLGKTKIKVHHPKKRIELAAKIFSKKRMIILLK